MLCGDLYVLTGIRTLQPTQLSDLLHCPLVPGTETSDAGYSYFICVFIDFRKAVHVLSDLRLILAHAQP